MSTVLIVMGSKSDLPVAEKAKNILLEFELEYEIHVASAHRTPQRLEEIISESEAQVIIAIAGMSAALPGAIAAITSRPVIGVPVSGNMNLDSILSIVQMPPGVPVAAVGLDRGDNAAILAAEILAIADKTLDSKIKNHRKKMADKVIADSEQVSSSV